MLDADYERKGVENMDDACNDDYMLALSLQQMDEANVNSGGGVQESTSQQEQTNKSQNAKEKQQVTQPQLRPSVSADVRRPVGQSMQQTAPIARQESAPAGSSDRESASRKDKKDKSSVNY